MKVGIIGLGKMGIAVAYRLRKGGYDVFGYDVDTKVCQEAEKIGVICTSSLQEIAKKNRNFVVDGTCR